MYTMGIYNIFNIKKFIQIVNEYNTTTMGFLNHIGAG
jgi:hypothetical protein